MNLDGLTIEELKTQLAKLVRARRDGLNRLKSLSLYRYSRGRCCSNGVDAHRSKLLQSAASQPIRQWRIR